MPSVTRKTKSIRDQRRDDLLDAVLPALQRLLLAGESYTELSVSRIASEAGVSRSTIYAHFRDKADLLRAWFAEVSEEIAAATEPWWELDADATREDLRRTLGEIVAAYRPHVVMMAAVYDAAVYDAAVREEVTNLIEANIDALRRHIEQGQAEGWVDPDIEPEATAAWLTWMAERAQHRIIRSASDDEVASQVDVYADIVWQSLYALAPSRTGG